MFVHLCANHHIDTIVFQCHLHSITLLEAEVFSTKLCSGVGHRRLIDVYAGYMTEVIRQVVVDNSAGAAHVQEVQVRKIIAL